MSIQRTAQTSSIPSRLCKSSPELRQSKQARSWRHIRLWSNKGAAGEQIVIQTQFRQVKHFVDSTRCVARDEGFDAVPMIERLRLLCCG